MKHHTYKELAKLNDKASADLRAIWNKWLYQACYTTHRRNEPSRTVRKLMRQHNAVEEYYTAIQKAYFTHESQL